MKYADLLPNRQMRLRFQLGQDARLERQHRAHALQYAYARIKSIFRKAERKHHLSAFPHQPGQPAEPSALAKYPLNFGGALKPLRMNTGPNFVSVKPICLNSPAISSFYEKCPVLKRDASEVRASRLLCDRSPPARSKGLVPRHRVVEQM